MLPPEIEGWLRKADADLVAARHLRTNPVIPMEIAAFHYHQAVEKAFKGLLVRRGEVPPRNHDLRALLALLGPTDFTDEEQDAADALTPFAVLARYPGFDAPPEPSLLDSFDLLAERSIMLLRASDPPPR